MSFFSAADHNAFLQNQARGRQEQAQAQALLLRENQTYAVQMIEPINNKIVDVFRQAGSVSKVFLVLNYNTDHGRHTWNFSAGHLESALIDLLSRQRNIPNERMKLSVNIRQGEGTGYIFDYDVQIDITFNPPLT